MTRTTRKMIEDILKMEEEHAEDLKSLLKNVLAESPFCGALGSGESTRNKAAASRRPANRRIRGGRLPVLHGASVPPSLAG
jgi:hypothetical protein